MQVPLPLNRFIALATYAVIVICLNRLPCSGRPREAARPDPNLGHEKGSQTELIPIAPGCEIRRRGSEQRIHFGEISTHCYSYQSGRL